jgi:hypothetical protein
MIEYTRSSDRYSYCLNNPLKYTDPSGWFYTNFLDKDGNLISHIEDGSNAVFQLTGNNKSDEYFQFTGYDPNQKGSNIINLESAIKGAQLYTLKNYTSTINDDGVCTETFCNYGTMNIAKTYESAVKAAGMTTDISDIQGSAKTIGSNLAKSEVVKSLTTLADAQKTAKDGGLVIGYYSGHVFTLNKEGNVNNVGAPRATNNIFDPKYTEKYNQKFYMLILNPK